MTGDIAEIADRQTAYRFISFRKTQLVHCWYMVSDKALQNVIMCYMIISVPLLHYLAQYKFLFE